METISSKKLLEILQKDKLSKTEFAKRCGVSTPTLYAWIKKDKDGIADYVTPEGISIEIFERKPWDVYVNEKDVDRQRLQDKVDDLTDEADRSNTRIIELTSEVEQYKVRLEAMQQTVDLLKDQISTKDAQIQALLVSLNQQMKALPMPKVSLWDRIFKKNKGPES